MERTNKLFTVTLCKYANMAVEADNPQQAMDIAKRYIKDHHYGKAGKHTNLSGQLIS